jgi:hypothetical protein
VDLVSFLLLLFSTSVLSFLILESSAFSNKL